MAEKGVIKFFNQLEDWGFITDSEGKDIFFHIKFGKGEKKEVKPGDQVFFQRELGPRGLRATWWSFVKEQKIYRVLYKRHDSDSNSIIFSTGTVDEIKYPTEFKQIKFQIKTESGWEECSDPWSKDNKSA